MKTRPEPGEIITYRYRRYKAMATTLELLDKPCRSYCALGGTSGCTYVRCDRPENEKARFLHFVELAPRKRRKRRDNSNKQQ